MRTHTYAYTFTSHNEQIEIKDVSSTFFASGGNASAKTAYQSGRIVYAKAIVNANSKTTVTAFYWPTSTAKIISFIAEAVQSTYIPLTIVGATDKMAINAYNPLTANATLSIYCVFMLL